MDDQHNPFVDLTADIVSAYVSHNPVRPAEVPELVASVHAALTGLSATKAVDDTKSVLKPAVPIKKSVTDDHIISLEDGRKFRSMKRHLAGLGMTPAEYRAKWGLPKDYPMVAPGYAAKRSELARAAGLGRKSIASVEPVTAIEPTVAAAPERAKRGRPATAQKASRKPRAQKVTAEAAE